jgi:ketosteroid isomerase-like protein
VVSARNVELVRSLQPAGADLVQMFKDARPQELATLVGLSELFDPALESSFVAGESSGAPTLTYHGIAGLIDGWREWLEAWDSYLIEAEEFIGCGDEVVAMVRVRATTRRGAVVMEHAPAAVWGFTGGKVARLDFYLDRAQALQAARARADAERTEQRG